MFKFGTEAFMDCPWCGTNANMTVRKIKDKNKYYAKCKKCKCRGPVNSYDEMTAVKEWNTRMAP